MSLLSYTSHIREPKMGRLYIAVAVWLVSMTCLFNAVRAQNGTRATTDPDEGIIYFFDIIKFSNIRIMIYVFCSSFLMIINMMMMMINASSYSYIFYLIYIDMKLNPSSGTEQDLRDVEDNGDGSMEHERRTLQRSSHRRQHQHRQLVLQPSHKMRLFLCRLHHLPHHRSVRVSISFFQLLICLPPVRRIASREIKNYTGGHVG